MFIFRIIKLGSCVFIIENVFVFCEIVIIFVRDFIVFFNNKSVVGLLLMMIIFCVLLFMRNIIL